MRDRLLGVLLWSLCACMCWGEEPKKETPRGDKGTVQAPPGPPAVGPAAVPVPTEPKGKVDDGLIKMTPQAPPQRLTFWYRGMDLGALNVDGEGYVIFEGRDVAACAMLLESAVPLIPRRQGSIQAVSKADTLSVFGSNSVTVVAAQPAWISVDGDRHLVFSGRWRQSAVSLFELAYGARKYVSPPEPVVPEKKAEEPKK